MKITVKIEGETFEVEIGPLTERPVIAQVDGQAFEVWPESEAPFQVKQPAAKPAMPPAQINTGTNQLAKEWVVAPIPGSIFLLKVQAGDQVQAGQELCILEAMKMKNIIRAPRAGRIAAVEVENGQQVAEGDVIVVFES